MKVLLDENLPKGLKQDFPGHEIFTVRDKNWNSKKNGELIRLMIDDGFDILITFDQNITYLPTELEQISNLPDCSKGANKHV